MSNIFDDIICLRIQALMRQQVLNQTKQTRQWLEHLDNKEHQLCQAGTEPRYMIATYSTRWQEFAHKNIIIVTILTCISLD